jgi:hypothetical protein
MGGQISRRALALASLLCAVAAPAIAASRPKTAAGTTTTTTTTGGTGLSGSGGSPGTSTGGSTTTTPAPTSPTGIAPPASVVSLTLGQVIWADADGITVGATGSVVHGGPVTFTGTAPASDAGSIALIRYAAASAPGGWVQAAQATVGPTGGFQATWNASARGRVALTVTLVPAGAVPASNPPTADLVVQVFSPAVATIYGPGLWGHRTACGERLRRSTVGVASRTLKCGTPVAVYYGGRELVVPVIDRGPFHSRAKWDLTEATADALGIQETSTVGTIEPWPRSQPLSAHS